MQGQAIFIAVSDLHEKAKALADLVLYAAEIKVKGLKASDEVVTLKNPSVTGETIKCLTPGDLDHLAENSELVIQFHLADQKYIAQLKAKITNGFICLDFSAPLYRVQRREDFRLRMPSSYQAMLAFQNDAKKLKCKLVDLSAGGCRIELPQTVVLADRQNFSATLIIVGRDDLKVDCQIRHIENAEELNLAGVQFTNQTDIVKNRMAGLVMDLYREFFKRT